MIKKLSFCFFLFVCILFSLFSKGILEKNSVDLPDKLRIVSLAPNVTEIICALECEDCLVGRTTYCNYPEYVQNITDIGNLYTPNLELIVSLKPDAVIATSIVSSAVVDKLNNYGIKTYQFLHENEGLNGSYSLIKDIAEILHVEKNADNLINSLQINEKYITDITNNIKDENKKRCAILITWGEWGDYAATGETFINDIINKAGGINIASNVTNWAISKELLINSDPEYIFITDNSNYVSGSISDAFCNTEPYSRLKASLRKNIFVLDSDSVSRQGVRSFEILNQIAKSLYPELFK